ncbi:MAG TPA: TonB-dependent receptor [Bryobacteraceae bacterium]|nr:TonB-dependent receptor [Bryobacteraceae bacterium]
MNRLTFQHILLCLVALWLAAVEQPVRAQTLYGSVVGNVKDSSDAVIAQAKVTLTNVETKQTREAATTDAGSYNFPTVPPGTYEIRVSKEGFTPYVQTGVVVAVNNTVRQDITLRLGAVSESVTVTGGIPLLQTDRAEVRSDVTSDQLGNLPMSIGRNYQTLFVTLPGFGGVQSSYNSTPSNPSKALVFNVNGASFNINNTKIDGAQSINVWLPHESAYVPTLEAIDTVNVVSGSFDAETGLAGGAAIYVSTKSGTNEIHGAAFAIHDNQHLNAAPFFLPLGQSKPKFIYNDFGGAVGGPIIKEKLFYFASYEGTNDRESAYVFATVPTAAIKSGNMQGGNNPIYDPMTGDPSGANRTPFPNQIVPAARMDPIAVKLASQTPLSNLPGNLLANNYYATGSYIFDRKRLDAKVNWNPNSKFTSFARFGFLNYNMDNPPIFGALGGNQVSSAGGNPGHGYGNTYSVTVAGTYLLRPTFIVDAYIGWARLGTNIETPGLDQKLGLALGIPGTNGPAHYQGGLPRFAVSGFDDIGTPGAYLPYYRQDPATNYVANFNWTKGTHDIRWGLDFSQLAMNQIQAESGYGAGMGGFIFSGGPTAILGGPSPNQFNSYAAFLLGLANQSGKNTIYAPNVGCPAGLCGAETTRAWRYGLYLRDRWNVTPALTLSYGLRWEYFPLPTRLDQGIGLYNPDTNTVQVCGYQVVPSGCNIKMSKRMFAPRVGIAYRVSSSFVIRAGYGITNDPYSLDRPLKYNYPTLLIQTYDPVNSYQWVTTLQQGIPAVQLPSLGNGILPLPGPYTTTTISPSAYNRGYIQSWNFTLQKELRWGFAAQAGYVATRSTDLDTAVNINAGQVIGAGVGGQPLYQQYGKTAAVTMYMPVGTNQYNSLQARLERRFSAGLQFAANYTWSKAVGIAANNDSGLRENAPAYWSLNRAVQNYDRTQNLQLQGMWELPFGKGKHWFSTPGAASAILGGWRINSITSFMTGLPFFVTAANQLSMLGSTQRADQVKPSVQTLGDVKGYFDPLAFKTVTGQRFGNAGFNSLRGPGVVNMDLAVSREFAITERYKLQFRFESFNFTNTPHFALPGTNVSNMVLNPDGSVKNLAGYTQITSTQNLGRDFDERHIQFDLRFTF